MPLPQTFDVNLKGDRRCMILKIFLKWMKKVISECTYEPRITQKCPPGHYYYLQAFEERYIVNPCSRISNTLGGWDDILKPPYFRFWKWPHEIPLS